MKQALITMLELQDTMNTTVHSDWRNQGNAWYRAIWVECAEMLDHYGWKWWKAQAPDIDQVELELIDIWHFGLSILLESAPKNTYEQAADNLYRVFSVLPESSESSGEALRLCIEEFALTTLSSKSFDVQGFAKLMSASGLSFDNLFRRYLAKNVLNIFRQEHGYKEGTYRKLWAGREDNEHLIEALDNLPQGELTRDRLYSELLARYESVDY